MPEQIQSFPLICQGGLKSSRNWLDLSATAPGSAATLQNFEPSLFGGYRRINGFAPLEPLEPEVDPENAEGRILGVFIFGEDVLCARKQQSSNTYEYYIWSPGLGWVKLTTGLTFNSVSVERIRHEVFNFNGTDKIIFVDGVNPALIYDGTNWTQIKSTNSGSTFATAGGDQAIDAPKYVCLFKNHIFVSGDPNFSDVIAHSAPNNEYDWTAASGAGQLNAGFVVQQLYPFRDNNYVFGEVRIKRISVNGTTFTINDVAQNVGCIAPDSVLEINGDLIFLSQDGFRPISATERNNDVELGSVSKDIQQDVISLSNTYTADAISGVVVRRKSQVRFFFSTASTSDDLADGVIGGLRGTPEGVSWEWGRLKGIKVACCTSGYIGKDEYVLHGSFDGKVHRQEVGSSFDGRDIVSIYATPYIDFGESQVRKTMRTINIFTRPEGPCQISMSIKYDWGRGGVINPPNYELESSGDISTYGDAVYGISTYGGAINPVMISNIEGSGFSSQLIFHTADTSQPYTIQGIVFEYSIDGRQ